MLRREFATKGEQRRVDEGEGEQKGCPAEASEKSHRAFGRAEKARASVEALYAKQTSKSLNSTAAPI